MSFSGFNDQPVDQTITNDGFFPDQNIETFQSVYRLPAEYESDMIAEHIVLAMAWANDQLDEWKQDQIDNYDTLADVPANRLNDDSVLTIRYNRAVGCYAKAILLKQFFTVERRPAANNDAKEGDESEDKFMEFAQAAIADFLQQPRITVASL